MSPFVPRHLVHSYRLPLRLLLAVVLATGLSTALNAFAQTSSVTSPAPRMESAVSGTLLSISAEAEARRVPDIARVSTGVVTQAADANAAMRANAEQMTRVVATIKRAGVAERDIRTGGIHLHPQYRHGDNQPPTISGYQASNTVDITVRDLARLGSTLDALVAGGANQINGPSFDVDDKESAYDEARRAAVDKARKRADMYAQILGMRVRRIVSISEGGSVGPPMPMMAMARMEQSSDTPISPGENALTVNLNVVFELEL